MSIVSVLRDRMVWREKTFPGLSTTRVANTNLAALLDIVEAMAEVEPVDWHGERACLYCRVNIEDGDDHAPDCPKLLADKLCGKDQDGAS